MSKFRVLGAAMLATALTLGAFAMPAAAINGDANLVIGHGIPGAVVDICVNDGSGQVEVKSNFKFGKWFKAALPAGTYKFITRVASPGNCKGAALIKATVPLAGGEDLSVIATKTKGTPTYQVFDNFIVTGARPAAPAAVLSIKHAAILGKVDVYLSVLLNDTLGPASAPPTLSAVPKGAQYDTFIGPSDIKVAVTKKDKNKILGQTPWWEVKPGFTNHVVAVGGPKNFRFLRYRTPTNLD